MQPAGTPPVRDLVLVGGGHSHVQVLKSIGMKPIPGVRVTLVTPDLLTPYSGMLPGHIAGRYSAADIHIKLGPLCQFAGVRMIIGSVQHIDLESNTLHLEGRPPIVFDALSINCGATPHIPYDGAVTVKPIGDFLPKWSRVRRALESGQTLAIVGSGAGGVELALAARTVLAGDIKIKVIGPRLLPGHGVKATELISAELERRDIEFVVGRGVSQICTRTLCCGSPTS